MNVKASRSKGLRKSVKRKCKNNEGMMGGEKEEIGGTFNKYTNLT